MIRRSISAALFATLATFAPAARAADIANVGTAKDGAVLISISGDLLPNDDQKFKAVTANVPRALVGLESRGGSLGASLAIGAEVRIRGYTTAVTTGSRCVSGCALIWLAGTTRLLSPTAYLGFHSASANEQTSGVGSAVMGAYLRDLGMSVQAIIFLTAAERQRIQWLTQSEAERLSITYRLVPDNEDDPKPFGAIAGTTNNTTADSTATARTSAQQWAYLACASQDAEFSEIDVVFGWTQSADKSTFTTNFWSVVHRGKNGAYYDRALQYTDITQQTSQSGHTWDGHRKAKLTDVMHASIGWGSAGNQWTYSEVLNGTVKVWSPCKAGQPAEIIRGGNILSAAGT